MISRAVLDYVVAPLVVAGTSLIIYLVLMQGWTLWQDWKADRRNPEPKRTPTDMDTFPAPPGTYILEREQGSKEARKIPVLGFQFVQRGPVYPLAAIAHGGLTRGRVLVTADGFVTDPSFGVVCGSVDEWMALADKPGYWAKTEPEQWAAFDAGEIPPTQGILDHYNRPAAPLSDTNEKLADAGAKLNGTPAPARIPDKPKGKPQVFQTTSFWRVAGHRDLGTPDRIFTVEGGVEAPAKNDAGYEKIKRDDFQAMKKAGAVVIDWPIRAEPASEPEDGEDDGSGLI